MHWGELFYFFQRSQPSVLEWIFLQNKVSQKGRTKDTRLLSIEYITFMKMNVGRRKNTNKKNGFFLLGASFIMFGYWYDASIMMNNMNTSLSFVQDVVKEQQTENEEDNSNSLA